MVVTINESDGPRRRGESNRVFLSQKDVVDINGDSLFGKILVIRDWTLPGGNSIAGGELATRPLVLTQTPCEVGEISGEKVTVLTLR